MTITEAFPYPATVSVDYRTFDEGAVTAEPNWSGMEVTLRGWSSPARGLHDLVSEVRLTPRQALRLAALLKDIALEVRGFTAWTRNTAEFIGWYRDKDEYWADMQSYPGTDGSVVIRASRDEVQEAIDSLRAEGWEPVPNRWQVPVLDRIDDLALTGD